MSRVARVFAAAFVLVAAFASSARAEWTLVEEHFFALSLAGSPCGRSSERVEHDAERVRTTSRLEMRFKRLGQETVLDFTTEFMENDHGDALEATVTQSGAAPTRYVFRDATHVEILRGDVKETRELASTSWLTPREVALLIKARNATKAAEIHFQTLDVQSGLVLTDLTMKRDGEATVTVAQRTVPATRYAVRNSLMPVLASELYDADGALLKSTTAIGLGDLVSTRTTRAKADEAFAASSFDLLAGTFVPCAAIPKLSTRESLGFTVKARNGALMDLPSIGAQRCERVDATTVRVSVELERASRGDEGDASDPRWLKANEIIDSDHEAIKALLARAKFASSPSDHPTRDQADVLRALVASHLRAKNLATAFGSASEAAKTRSGDCTEHAVLLAALLRAQGVASRVASGLVYVENLGGKGPGFGWHLWTQALVEIPRVKREREGEGEGEGERVSELGWLDFDATLAPRGPRFHTGHLLVATSDLAGGATDSAFAQAIGLVGSIEITIDEKPAEAAEKDGARP